MPSNPYTPSNAQDQSQSRLLDYSAPFVVDILVVVFAVVSYGTFMLPHSAIDLIIAGVPLYNPFPFLASVVLVVWTTRRAIQWKWRALIIPLALFAWYYIALYYFHEAIPSDFLRFPQ